MFINTKILKQLMKEAYKSGLSIGQTEDEIHISGKNWTADIKKRWMPKQIMAQIIELAGELPDVGNEKLYYRINGTDCSEDAGEISEEEKGEQHRRPIFERLQNRMENKYGTVFR